MMLITCSTVSRFGLNAAHYFTRSLCQGPTHDFAGVVDLADDSVVSAACQVAFFGHDGEQ